MDTSAVPLDPSAVPLNPSAVPLNPSAVPLNPSAVPLEWLPNDLRYMILDYLLEHPGHILGLYRLNRRWRAAILARASRYLRAQVVCEHLVRTSPTYAQSFINMILVTMTRCSFHKNLKRYCWKCRLGGVTPTMSGLDRLWVSYIPGKRNSLLIIGTELESEIRRYHTPLIRRFYYVDDEDMQDVVIRSRYWDWLRECMHDAFRTIHIGS